MGGVNVYAVTQTTVHLVTRGTGMNAGRYLKVHKKTVSMPKMEYVFNVHTHVGVNVLGKHALID